MERDDAKDLILFIEMLLKFIYEFPKMVPASSEKQNQADSEKKI